MTNMLVIVPDEDYSGRLYDIIKEAESVAAKTLYVSLNKTYQSLKSNFSDKGIDTGKFCFIDSITATIISPKPVDDCTFLTSAEDVKQLYAAIIKIVKEQNVEMLIFDSLSCLTTYTNTNEIDHFVANLLAALSLLNCPAAFTCLKSDDHVPLVQHIKMKVDKTIELN